MRLSVQVRPDSSTPQRWLGSFGVGFLKAWWTVFKNLKSLAAGWGCGQTKLELDMVSDETARAKVSEWLCLIRQFYWFESRQKERSFLLNNTVRHYCPPKAGSVDKDSVSDPDPHWFWSAGTRSGTRGHDLYKNRKKWRNTMFWSGSPIAWTSFMKS